MYYIYFVNWLILFYQSDRILLITNKNIPTPKTNKLRILFEKIITYFDDNKIETKISLSLI